MSVFRRQTSKGITKHYHYRFTVKGKLHQGVCHGCTTPTEARDFEANVRASVGKLAQQETLNDLYTNCRDMLVSKNPVYLVDAYDKAQEKPRKRTPGKEREAFKRNYWNDFVAYMSRHNPSIQYLQDVTPVHAENYIHFIRTKGSFSKFDQSPKKQLLAHATLNEYHNTLIQTFNLLKNETGMIENPFSGIEKLANESESREAFSLEQLKEMFTQADNFLYPIFMIGLFSGLRLGDICTLKISDVDFDRQFIYRKTRKTSKLSSIPMLPSLQEYLRQTIPASGEYVLSDHAALYLRNPSNITQRVKHFLEADLNICTTEQLPGRTRVCSRLGFHSFRHTLCSLAGIVGIPMSVVSSILGELTPSMLALYSRHVEEQDKLQYIKLLGDMRLNLIPLQSSPLQLLFPTEDPEREALIQKIKELPIEEVRTLLELVS